MDKNTIMKILEELGISDYSAELPGYLLQIYSKLVQDVLINAKKFSKSDNRIKINKADLIFLEKIKCQIDARTSKDIFEFAAKINEKPLPSIIEKSGIKIPNEDTLTNTNYKMKNFQKNHSNIRTNADNYKIPIKFVTSVQNPQLLEVVEIMKNKNNNNRQQSRYLEYLKKVLLRRHYNMQK